MSERRDHAVTFHWSHPWMSGVHNVVLDLDSEEERERARPHIDALLAMLREKQEPSGEEVKLFLGMQMPTLAELAGYGDDPRTVGGGLLGLLTSFVDNRKRGLLNNIQGGPGLLGTRINEDARDFNREQRSWAGAEQSVIPELRDMAAQRTMGQALSMGGLLGMTAQTKPAFDFTNPGGGSRVARVGKTEVTYGVGKDGTADLILVETPKKHRGQGSARTALEQFTREADAHGLRLKLDATPMDKSTTQEGLNALYESLGFRKYGDRWFRDPS